MIKQTSDGFKIDEVYANLATHLAQISIGKQCWGNTHIPFKKNITGKKGGSVIWEKIYYYFKLNREEFLEHYHKRNNIESSDAAIKGKFVETMKSKNYVAQVNELLAKIIAYNMTVVIHDMYENGIESEFFKRED